MKRIWKGSFRLVFTLAAIMLFSACGRTPEGVQSPENDKIRVIVTTTFIGDVVENIAGDNVEITSLLTVGQNPHSYQPSPMDMVAVTNADLILANGFGLEDFLEDLLSGSDTKAEVVVVSEGIKPLLKEGHTETNDNHDSGDAMDAVMGQDPHVWFNPNNVQVWVDNIARALAQKDPANAVLYQENKEKYQEELRDLDTWIKGQVELIPPENRELVTDHTSLSYFAQEYGLVQVGAVIPALTTEAETSGMELAELIDTIREQNTKAIFIGVDFNLALAQRVADETGVDLVKLYFGSLSDGAPAGTYISFMRYNVSAITEALR